MNKDSKIFIAGASGLVGSSIMRRLKAEGFINLLTPSRSVLDLLYNSEVEEFFELYKPEYVFFCAAKVGGIYANMYYPADFIYNNLVIQSNIISNAYLFKVKKLLFLGSSCIYPKDCPQPIKEEYFLSGILEPTNDAYAIAKIAGIKMCQSFNKQYGTNFISVMPTNLYGPGDHYNKDNSHVIPALIRKFYLAKINDLPYIELWGTGEALREFLYVDDLAEACIMLMEKYNDNKIINIGYGEDDTIYHLASMIACIIDYRGKIIFNGQVSDGMRQKLLDSSKINKLGWYSKTELLDGLKLTYKDFKNRYENGEFKDF